MGNSSPVGLLEYIAALEKALCKKAEREMLPLQPGDIPDTYADVTDLVEQFHFKPSTPIEQGVANFVVWHQNYFSV
jgi:UDP-glucuronate 4-epimerase